MLRNLTREPEWQGILTCTVINHKFHVLRGERREERGEQRQDKKRYVYAHCTLCNNNENDKVIDILLFHTLLFDHLQDPPHFHISQLYAHNFTLSPFHSFTRSLFHSFTLSLFQTFTLLCFTTCGWSSSRSSRFSSNSHNHTLAQPFTDCILINHTLWH